MGVTVCFLHDSSERVHHLVDDSPISQFVALGDSLLAALMMIDLNGPDIKAVDEVKALILESVNLWKNYKKWMPSRSSAGVHRNIVWKSRRVLLASLQSSLSQKRVAGLKK
jgi:hypothetical protein